MALKSGRVGIHPSQVDPITGMLLSSPGGASDLSDLDDVAISSVTNDQILRYNSTSEKWENEDMPAIPAAQVNSDWNATSGVAEILNKPTIPAAQVNSDWNAASGVAQILNKPTIPTNVSDLTNGYVWTSGVSALAGATTATITDATITTNSTIEVFASVQGLPDPELTVSTGSCVLTFDALAQNTTFKLRISN